MGNLSCGNLDPPPSSGGQSAASSPSALHEDGLTKRFRRCRSPFREPPKSDRHPVGMVIAIISESRSASVRNRDRHRSEYAHHLGYEKHDPVGNNSGNSRNGASSKTVKGDFGELEIEVPRDRVSTFEPQILPKHQTRFTGFDDKIVSLYARGMTTREIEGHLKEIYGGSQRRADLPSDRGGQRRGAVVAEPGAGAHLRDRVPGCAVRENAARRARGKPGRAQRGAGAVDQRQ